jgi:hypothetical protein
MVNSENPPMTGHLFALGISCALIQTPPSLSSWGAVLHSGILKVASRGFGDNLNRVLWGEDINCDMMEHLVYLIRHGYVVML